MMIYPEFKDSALGNQFEQEGFVIIKAGWKSGLNAISEYINSLNISFDDNFFYSLLTYDFSKNKEISNEVNKNLQELYDTIFTNYKVRNASFLMKPQGDKKEMFLHQDWCFTDINRFQTGTVWAPLCDVDEHNGSMFLIPKSHKFFSNYISGNLPTARISSEQIPSDALIPIRMSYGDVLIFNPISFHGSYPNLSGKPRIVVTASIFPQDAPYCYYHKVSEDKVAKLNIDDDAIIRSLLTFVQGDLRLDGHHEIINYIHSIPDSNDLVRSLRLSPVK